MNFKVFCVTVLMVLFYTSSVNSQVYSELTDKPQDTLEYKNLLPIFGKKVKELGFDLPYSAGISVNYLWQKSDIVISNVAVGFNSGDLINVDDIIRFNSTTAESNGVNIRPDVWLFPFLNVYGIFAQAQSRTNVDVSIVIPRINEAEELFNIQTNPLFNTTTVGFGLTPTAGFFGGWIAFDMNFTWTDVDAQENPVFAFVFDPRIGKTFQLRKPNRNISFWVGGFRLKVKRDTRGSLGLDEVLPFEEWNSKVAAGQTKVGDAQQELDQWWENLSPIQQQNPVNIVKRETNQAKLNVASRFLNGAESALDTAESSTIDYSLDKRQLSMWNFVVGSQFQINKSWMLRAEYGFSEGRNTFFTGLQYRFGL
ncbi:hypothetical protein J4050_02065 [Winogradskyella sp. DF17]|uniref:Uncharacterized protein n=1 Tax=Winogradskyella pelagia TaxID=2819984 RepID=A0ABS3SYG9_9FLAO|nr:hypothetical protein [Winogradskyella sp. DF17]MBO3115512.1 hypothetical protein [Winogradskyella sp. DF17]